MKHCKAARWMRAPLAACLAVAMFGGVTTEVGAAGTGTSQNASSLDDEDVKFNCDLSPVSRRVDPDLSLAGWHQLLDGIEFEFSNQGHSESEAPSRLFQAAQPLFSQAPKLVFPQSVLDKDPADTSHYRLSEPLSLDDSSEFVSGASSASFHVLTKAALAKALARALHEPRQAARDVGGEDWQLCLRCKRPRMPGDPALYLAMQRFRDDALHQRRSEGEEQDCLLRMELSPSTLQKAIACAIVDQSRSSRDGEDEDWGDTRCALRLSGSSNGGDYMVLAPLTFDLFAQGDSEKPEPQARFCEEVLRRYAELAQTQARQMDRVGNEASRAPNRAAAKMATEPRKPHAGGVTSLPYTKGYEKGELARGRAALDARQKRFDKYADQANGRRAKRLTGAQGSGNGAGPGGMGREQSLQRTAQYGAVDDAFHQLKEAVTRGGDDAVRTLLQCEKCLPMFGPYADAAARQALEQLDTLTHSSSVIASLHGWLGHLLNYEFVDAHVAGSVAPGEPLAGPMLDELLARDDRRDRTLGIRLAGGGAPLLSLPQRERIAAVVARAPGWNAAQPRYIFATLSGAEEITFHGAPEASRSGAVFRIDALPNDVDGSIMRQVEYVIYRPLRDV